MQKLFCDYGVFGTERVKTLKSIWFIKRIKSYTKLNKINNINLDLAARGLFLISVIET